MDLANNQNVSNVIEHVKLVKEQQLLVENVLKIELELQIVHAHTVT
jgi:hypothetical protein